MPKVRGLHVDLGKRSPKEKYEEIYQSPEIWLYAKSQGTHSAILGQILDEVHGARVLDVGCGAGRMSLMCAARAQQVLGVDFSETAISVARMAAQASSARNVEFVVADATQPGVLDQDRFDVALLLGVLEHVPDPAQLLARVRQSLRPGGLLVASCPNFWNFRGMGYMTLLSLLGLPMSLADLRQVSAEDIDWWAHQANLEPERFVGMLYRFAWDELAAQDMAKRVPAALDDADLPIAVNLGEYERWLRATASANHRFLEALEAQGILRRIQRVVALNVHRPPGLSDELWKRLARYLTEDLEMDPYYCTQEPFCFLGGEVAYLLRKLAA